MHRIAVAALLLASAVAPARAALPQTLTYEAVTAASPDGVSRLRLTPVDNGAYAVDLYIVAPNRTRHQGHIQGLATRDGERLTLRAPNFMENGKLDDPALCTLVIDADDTHAQVVSAHQCAGFHGAAASFIEQGRNLVRVH